MNGDIKVDKYKYSTDHNEMRRRWEVTLAEMDKQEIDCLILYATVGRLNGSMMYLTDVFTSGSYPHCGMFSRDGIFLFGHGYKGGTMAPAEKLGLINITENIGIPITPAMCYADNDFPAEMERIIKSRGYKKIGFVDMAKTAASIYKYLTENLRECEFVNATDMIDQIKAVKSEYDIQRWKDAIDTVEKVFAQFPSVVKPGMTEHQVVCEMEYIARSFDCPVTSIMMGSDPKKPIKSPDIYRNKVIEEHDYINFLLELAAPGGLWCEIARIFSFGEPSTEMRKAEKDSVELQALIAKNAVPGASPAELLALLNSKLTARGYRPETRIFAHGQGYDIVERPVFCADETMELKENMIVAIHPSCGNADAYCGNTDDYMITKSGAVRLNTIPSGIWVL
ncbi:MAG: aminopeptidase P family protein [Lachnospiraceae bacterium]|nr:aminopeptidase P family protein [Lachnospiraceae bacterium]